MNYRKPAKLELEKKKENITFCYINIYKTAISNAVSLNLLYKQDSLSYSPILEIWRLLLGFCI